MWRWEARERRFRASTRGLNPSLWRPRYKWDARRIRGRDGSEDFLQPSAVRNSRKRLDSNNFFLLLRVFFNLPSALTWATETVTFASVTQRESNRLHDAPLLYTPRTITTSLHFPARTPGKARGCGRHARRGYLPDLSPRRRTGSGPTAVSRAASVARSDLNRALWTLGTRPRHLDVSPSARARPGPRAFPFVSMGAPFLEPPGRASHTYRSDEMAFATAKVPDRALAAKRFVETHYRGADFLGARAAGRVGTRPRRWARRPCGACAGTRAREVPSTTRDGLAFPRHTPRPFGFGGGPGRRDGAYRRGAARERPPRVVRLRRRARAGAAGRRAWVRASETRASRKVRSAWGTGASRSKNRSPPPPARPADGARASPWSARETTSADANIVSRARLASETILSRSASARRVAFPGGAREASDDPRVEGERRSGRTRNRRWS